MDFRAGGVSRASRRHPLACPALPQAANGQKLLVDGVERGAGLLARLTTYVEINPQALGVAVDPKAIPRDMAERKTLTS